MSPAADASAPGELTPVGSQTDPRTFRLRGLTMTRIETFTDAAFAFALTLLVISLEPPASLAGLEDALLGAPAFLLSATMLMMFWWAHHDWSRRYGLDDAATVILSCLLVFTVLLYVYPLKFMFGMMMAWLSQFGLPLGQAMHVAEPTDVNRMFVIYGVGFIAMSGAVLLLNLHAWRKRDQLALDRFERHETRTAIGAWLILAVAGALSVIVAVAAPPTLVGLPGWVYAPLGVVMPLYSRAMRRRRPA